jgi:hypothetical protein
MFLHLKRDLPAEQIAWQECPSHLKDSDFVAARDLRHDATTYKVAVDMQRKLAAIRTDLDSLNDVEAAALMTSGYFMTTAQFEGSSPCVEGFAAPTTTTPWWFLQVASALAPRAISDATDDQRSKVARLLEVGASGGFKVWKLSPVLRALRVVLALSVVGGAAWLVVQRWETTLLPAFIASLTVKVVSISVLTVALTAAVAFVLDRVVGKRFSTGIMRVVRWRETLRSVLTGIGMATLGFLIARVHLHVFDRWYLHRGRMAERRKTG